MLLEAFHHVGDVLHILLEWVDLDLVGGTFGKIANVLPFVHAVDLERAMINGNFSAAVPHLYPVLGYSVIVLIGAVFVFLRQMKKQ